MSDDEASVKARARDYLRKRGTLVPAGVVHDRVAGAFAALETFLDTVPLANVSRQGAPGEWTIQDIVDHLLETHRAGLDELRCLLAGQRPPGEAIPAALRSKAPLLRPWPWLRDELRRVHGAIAERLAEVPVGFVTDARAPLVMVAHLDEAGERPTPISWVEELDWKAYAIVWRLHVLEHLNQAKKVLAALGPRSDA